MEIIGFSEEFLDGIAEIEKTSFKNAWTKKMLSDSSKSHLVKFKILIENEKLIGYYIARLAAEQAEILSIAVDKFFRGRSFGKSLLCDIEKESIKSNCDRIFLEVGVNNIAALNLYRNFGFKEIGVRKKYYGGKEDAFVMRKDIGEK